MIGCSCWNVARDGHQLDCAWAREQRRIHRLVQASPDLRQLLEDVGAIPQPRILLRPALASWTEPELRLAFGDR